MSQNEDTTPVSLPFYGLSVTASSEKNIQDVKRIESTLIDGNHLANFQLIAGLVDSGVAIVKRELTKDESDKVYDLKVNAQFDEAEELEQKSEKEWEVNFIKHLN